MIVKNRYYYRSRIKEVQFRQLIRCFAMDYTATSTAESTHISIRSINTIYLKVRLRIAQFCELESPLQRAAETNESSSGKQPVSIKRSRDTYHQTIIFGMLKHHDKIFTEIVPDCSRAILQAVIRGLISPDTVIHSEGWRGYDGLVDVRFGKHFTVHRDDNELISGINIESFWRFAKRRLAKFNGVPEHTFYLHLKETEFRFNHRHDNLYYALLKLLRLNPI